MAQRLKLLGRLVLVLAQRMREASRVVEVPQRLVLVLVR